MQFLARHGDSIAPVPGRGRNGRSQSAGLNQDACDADLGGATVSESTNNPLLIWELRSKACRWPLWDSWATLPQVEERFYCGASCAGAYCSDHVAIAGQGWGSSKRRLSVTA
jgi:hypothetical protein